MTLSPPATLVRSRKALTVSPLKTSAPLGAAMAFMGIDGCLPLFHGAQGCTAFSLVMMVRHFREAIPLQTTAMNEVTTILGGLENIEQALLNITKRTHPKVIGLITTGLTETRGEDMVGDLKTIRQRNPVLDDTAVVLTSTPDFSGGLETGWGKAVSAMIATLVPAGPQPRDAERVTVLAGCHLTPGDIEELRDIIEAFGLRPTILPDLSGSLDGHLPETWVPTTLGGTPLEEIQTLGRAARTIAIGEHMRISGALLEERTGVPTTFLDRVTGLEAVDTLMSLLAEISGRPVPMRLRRQRSQLIDALMDSHFSFGGSRLALAGEPDLVWTLGTLVSGLGARLQAVVTSVDAPFLAGLDTEEVVVGDLEDLAERAGGCDLMIANANARLPAERAGVALFRAGFPILDRLGVAHRVALGYRGTRDTVFALGNALIEAAQAGHDHTAHPANTNRAEEGADHGRSPLALG
ncbi:nitrogenase iron-molybdenum cofactor biosynthesis protein NifN [Rhodospirillum rubrum]|uniref:nitrogenase iron-molybdenum cofactor biosynthesis protein NifN n=1 Tax=Rhodospirillum rubrum TaxID=1085 RepID=UPI00190897ED|nr:nitrogenase iron-molybdenum cofactor biosynthesis protein NifN [Rhodospirillum rubrum]MBK1666064.1 nitrogenase iron-molybdenum cofactor biosynthesis protein NifN [Rhodospirillum rubrum]MBK1677149.1 nitrogenase iron-molybdenum cofactor biosynthesis protein NifN [Rhodospirillum rubrum]